MQPSDFLLPSTIAWHSGAHHLRSFHRGPHLCGIYGGPMFHQGAGNVGAPHDGKLPESAASHRKHRIQMRRRTKMCGSVVSNHIQLHAPMMSNLLQAPCVDLVGWTNERMTLPSSCGSTIGSSSSGSSTCGCHCTRVLGPSGLLACGWGWGEVSASGIG